MDIRDLLIEIGFTKLPNCDVYRLTTAYKNDYGFDRFTYIRDNNGIYNLITEKPNFVSMRLEVKEENEQLVYDFISNHFGKEYVRNFKLNKLI